MPCLHAFGPEAVSHLRSADIPLAFCRWAPVEQDRIGRGLTDTGRTVKHNVTSPEKAEDTHSLPQTDLLKLLDFFQELFLQELFLLLELQDFFSLLLLANFWVLRTWRDWKGRAGKVYTGHVSFLFRGQRIFKPDLLLNNNLFLFSLFLNIIKGNWRTFSHASGHPTEPGNYIYLLYFGSVILEAMIKCLMFQTHPRKNFIFLSRREGKMFLEIVV